MKNATSAIAELEERVRVLEARLADVEAKVRALTNQWVYGINEETLSAAIGKLLVKQGLKVATIGCVDAGVATVTSPAPLRSVARPVMAGAPPIPREPPITSTRP